jgi:hypothetical protein
MRSESTEGSFVGLPAGKEGRRLKAFGATKRIVLVAALLTVPLALLLISHPGEIGAPRFERFGLRTNLPPSVRIYPAILSESPLHGKRMWLQISYSNEPIPSLLLDLEKRKVVGQLNNGFPLMMTEDETKLLCIQLVLSPNLKERLAALLERISRGWIKAPPRPIARAIYWLLDLQDNSAARIGRRLELPSFPFRPSADHRFGFTAALRPVDGNGFESNILPNEAVTVPCFYENSVVYFRSNTIWQVNLDATHNVQLFPSP